MSHIQKLMDAVDAGQANADELLPLVYDELRRLANQRLRHEHRLPRSGATSLVHDAYLRMVGPNQEASFANHRHFFAAAAESMRRILIDRARKNATEKHGGSHQRLDLDLLVLGDPNQVQGDFELIALDEAIEHLAKHDPTAAELVKLRFFGGFGHGEAAQVLGVSRRQADRLWVLAKTWLFDQLSDSNQADD